MVNETSLTSEELSMSPTGWDLRRRAPRVEDRVLMADTMDLLTHLPKGVRPTRLARQFPRILNEVRARWADTASLKNYLNELLEDHRGDRQGFPSLVREELAALLGYVSQRVDPAALPAAA